MASSAVDCTHDTPRGGRALPWLCHGAVVVAANAPFYAVDLYLCLFGSLQGAVGRGAGAGARAVCPDFVRRFDCSWLVCRCIAACATTDSGPYQLRQEGGFSVRGLARSAVAGSQLSCLGQLGRAAAGPNGVGPGHTVDCPLFTFGGPAAVAADAGLGMVAGLFGGVCA